MNRIIYQNEGLFVGPNFVHGQSYSPNQVIEGNLDKVQSVQYDFSTVRESAAAIGATAGIGKFIADSPAARLTVDYISASFENEKLFGLDISKTNEQKPITSGISSETDRSKDGKNIYLVTIKEGVDLRSGNINDVEGVLSFNDCKLENYSMDISVGGIPSCSASFLADDANYYSSGQNLDIPILDKRNRDILSNVPVTIPTGFGKEIIFTTSKDTITAENITVNIFSGDGSDDIDNVASSGFFNFENKNVQSFEVSFDLRRTPVDLIGHKITMDRIPSYPITVSSNLSFIANTGQIKSLNSFVQENEKYKVVAEVRNKQGQKIMQYDFVNAVVDSVSYQQQMGENKQVSLQLSTELDPADTSQGLFLSGNM